MMDVNNSILAIGIPTYNNAEALELSINKMIDLCLKYNIHIYICDNASPDSTKEKCLNFEKKYPIIHYYRHESNIGPDDNFEFALKIPQTKYRWLLSDTCYLTDIDGLVDDLTKNDYDAYIVNKKNYRSNHLPKEPVVYDDSRTVLEEVGWHTTWISSTIYNQNLIKKLDFDRWKNSSFNQMAITFETTAFVRTVIKFNPNVFLSDLEIHKTSGWHYHYFYVFYRQLWEMLMSLPIYYSYETKLKCYVNHTRIALSFSRDLRLWLNGSWTLSALKKDKFFVKQSGKPYLLLCTMAIVPGFIRKFVRFLYNLRLSFLHKDCFKV